MVDGANTTLWLELTAKRTLSHTSVITTSTGTRELSWSQSLFYTNTQNLTALGNNQTLYQITSGTNTFSSMPDVLNPLQLPITNTYTYPISFYSANINPINQELTNSTLVSALDRSLISTSIPLTSYLTSPLIITVPEVFSTRQNGSAIYFWNNTYYEFAGAIDPAIRTTGETEQWFSYSGSEVEGGLGLVQEYGRHTKSSDGYEPVLVLDETYKTTITVPPTEVVPEGDL